MAAMGNDSFIAGEMAPPQRFLYPPEKICMEWRQRQRVGAGLCNLGNTCFLNSILQCLTYTPPLANYLLSREHSQTCHRRDLCMMCSMEQHVNEALQPSDTAIKPWAVIRVLTRIGKDFQLGKQGGARRCLHRTVNTMQRACLSRRSSLDTSSRSTTIVHQIFMGSLRSRVTCLSCNAVSSSYRSFLDILLDIKDASSVTAALENFVKPRQLDGANGFKCSKCDKTAAASQELTVQHVPRVLTMCLKRREDINSRKITKVVEYPQYLDLRPYTSQTAGEPLLYSLYAVVVHRGDTCHTGHYYCYVKASDGLWYEMNDASVDPCDLDTVLSQQAYLLFYVRCSELQVEERASSSPLSASAFLSQRVPGRKPAGPVAPQGLSHQTKVTGEDVVVGTEESPENSGSSTPASTSWLPWAGAWETFSGWLSHVWPGQLSMASCMGSSLHCFICRCLRLASRREAACSVCSQSFGRVLHTVPDESNEDEHRFSPSSPCQSNGDKERARSTSALHSCDLRRWFVEDMEHHCSVRRRRRTSPPSFDCSQR